MTNKRVEYCKIQRQNTEINYTSLQWQGGVVNWDYNNDIHFTNVKVWNT